jgi:hypothetical protein
MAFDGTLFNILSRDEHKPMYRGDGDGLRVRVPVGVCDEVAVPDEVLVGRVEPDGNDDGETDPVRDRVMVPDGVLQGDAVTESVTVVDGDLLKEIVDEGLNVMAILADAP